MRVMRKLTRLVWTCAACCTLGFTQLAFAQPAPARDQPGGSPPEGRQQPRGMQVGGTLRVAGDGQIQVAPDHAVVRLGATAQANEASAAQEQVNQIMQRALEAVRALGIEDEKIRTSELSLWPVYDQPQPNERGVMRPPTIVGYQASNVISVELEDLTRIGGVIDACVAVGANQLQGVEFGLRNDTRAKAEALRRAVAAARAKAEVLAQAAGQPLGELVELNEAGVDYRPPEPMYARGAMAMDMAATPTQVQPGQLTMTARVNLVYRLRPGGGPPPRDPPATRQE